MPTRSASFSFARVKLIYCCMAAPVRHGDAAERGVAGAGGGADQDGREDGRHGGDALPPLRADSARDVPLRDVRDFVGEYAGELRFVARGQHQSVVHADESAGQRERVDGVVVHEEERETLCRIAGGLGDDARPQRLQIFSGLGVFDDLALVTQLAHDLQPDVELVVERERRGGRAADVGQVVAISTARRTAATPAPTAARRRAFSDRLASRNWTPESRPRSFKYRGLRAYQRRNPPGGSVRRAPA